ncbi:MAG: hypothetical protein JNN11_02295 [Candidatus Doudnabacteria bacterium]|nr:hypothetical protein [Candidatus Doudnabacteria bacterium]
MKFNKKHLVLVGVIGLAILAVAFLNKKPALPVENKQESAQAIKNQITIVDSVGLEAAEKNEIKAEVDVYMNKYKLPKDIENVYTIQIQSRINNALKVETNPGEQPDDFRSILYLRNVNGVWRLDESAGPECAFELFERGECE